MEDDLGTLVAKLAADIADLKSGLSAGKKELDAFKPWAIEWAGHIKKALIFTVSVVVGGAVFKEAIDAFVQVNSRAKELSAIMGLNMGDAGALGLTFQRVGVDGETLTSSLLKMTKQLKTNEDGFNQLGIVTRDSSGNLLPLNEIMLNSINRLKEYKEGTDRTEAAMTVFGRSVGNMPGFLKITRQAIEETRQRMAALGLELSDESAAKARAYKEGLQDLGLIFTALKYKIGSEILPALIQLGQFFATVGPPAAEALNSIIGFFQNVLMAATVAVTSIRNGFLDLWDQIKIGAKTAENIYWSLFIDGGAAAAAAGFAAMKKASADWLAQSVRDANTVRFAIMSSFPATPGKFSFMTGEPKAPVPEKKPSGLAYVPPVTGKGGKGTTEEDLYAEYLKLAEQKRQLEIQEAQASLDLLKATDAAKKAELEKNLAAGLLSGQEYYGRLQELQQTETAAALKLIDTKRAAQAAAYQDQLADLERQEISPEAKAYREQTLAAQNALVAAQLNAEAAKARLDGEVKITNELKRQVEVRQKYQDQTAALNIETQSLLGQISEQEATLQKLYLDWQKAKRDAITAGASPADLAALDRNLQAKQFDAQYGNVFRSLQSSMSEGLQSLAESLGQGGFKFRDAVAKLGMSINKALFKMLADDLAGAMVRGIKSLWAQLTQALEESSGGGGGGLGGLLSGIPIIGGLFSSIFGGSSSLGLIPDVFGYLPMMFDEGGISTRPSLAMVSESGPEAHVPLAGGAIPVRIDSLPAGEVHHHHYEFTIQAIDTQGFESALERSKDKIFKMAEDGARNFRYSRSRF